MLETSQFKRVCIAVILVILAVMPFFTREPYVFHILCLIGINIIFAASLNAILNIGELNLAQAAFMGIGAYASTLLVTMAGLSFGLPYLWPLWLLQPFHFL